MTDSLDALTTFFNRHEKLVVLTGAGVSANSGIPTYRDAQGRWLRNRPIQHQEFLQQESKRRRYWGRSMVGWPGVRDARPNTVHLALSRLEQANRVTLLITQNVDRLHQRAGSHNTVDLHGRLDKVNCLNCQARYERDWLQGELERANPDHHGFRAHARPDGDADLSEAQVADIRIVDCKICGGILMPDVVFFGGTVPRERVERCRSAIESADALVVIGSSLKVYSGFRFCKQAIQHGKTLVVINEGNTRADDIADLKVEHNAMEQLIKAIDRLGPARPQARQLPSVHNL